MSNYVQNCIASWSDTKGVTGGPRAQVGARHEFTVTYHTQQNMSMAKPANRLQATTQSGGRKRVSHLAPLGASKRYTPPSGPSASRRASVAGLTSAPKTQRSSKTTHKLVVLPSAPQTRPLLADVENDLTLGHETDGGVREYKSQAERMTKDQRKDAGFKRITVYCIAESFKMKLLSSFLKREHNVSPRAFDEALYVVSTQEVLLACFFLELNNSRCIIYHYFLDMVLAQTYGLQYLL